MVYVKVGPWVNGAAPPISAANLDTVETQYDEAVADAAVHAALPNAHHARAHAMDDALDHSVGTAGDILYAGGGGAWAKLAKGTQTKRLMQGAAAPEWQYEVVAIEVPVGDGVVAISTGIKFRLMVPFSGTIVSWTIGADISGSIQFDIWKDTYANYPPTIADTIVAADKPKIVTAIKATGSALAGWTTNIVAGDWLFINVDSCTTIKQATLCLNLNKGY